MKGVSKMFDLENGNEFEQWLVNPDVPAWQLLEKYDEKEGEEHDNI